MEISLGFLIYELEILVPTTVIPFWKDSDVPLWLHARIDCNDICILLVFTTLTFKKFSYLKQSIDLLQFALFFHFTRHMTFSFTHAYKLSRKGLEVKRIISYKNMSCASGMARLSAARELTDGISHRGFIIKMNNIDGKFWLLAVTLPGRDSRVLDASGLNSSLSNTQEVSVQTIAPPWENASVFA